jgi:hypothetical protein
VILADLLRVQGHAATTTRDKERLGNPDPVQPLFAADNGVTLVTHNRADFARLHEAWLTWSVGWEVARSHTGIIVLGRVRSKPPEEYAAHIGDLLREVRQPLVDTFFRWHPESGWTQSG